MKMKTEVHNLLRVRSSSLSPIKSIVHSGDGFPQATAVVGRCVLDHFICSF